jgi:ubiquinone/menaquinone biosynthesis C-methylase UbiE
MTEIDIFGDIYPKRNRDTKSRKIQKSSKIIKDAKKFGWEYFDKKGVCYDGYSYDGRWVPIAKKFVELYNLKKGDKVLDIGCAKGYMVYDFLDLGIDTYGVDISKYAIDCSPQEIKWRLKVADAKNLEVYKDKSFDLVISINTIHNLPEVDCRKALREIQRIGKKAFIIVDSWRSEEEKQRMLDWCVTGITLKGTEDWKKMFKEEGYTGDYYWFIP